jgi:hypothetical protein
MAKSSTPRKAQQTPSAQPPEAPPSTAAGKDGNRPIHSIRYSGCEAAIWKNSSDGRDFYSVTVRKSWRDEQGEWHDGQTFLASDLPMLAKAVTDAHSWISWQQRHKGKKPEKGG